MKSLTFELVSEVAPYLPTYLKQKPASERELKRKVRTVRDSFWFSSIASSRSSARGRIAWHSIQISRWISTCITLHHEEQPVNVNRQVSSPFVNPQNKSHVYRVYHTYI